MKLSCFSFLTSIFLYCGESVNFWTGRPLHPPEVWHSQLRLFLYHSLGDNCSPSCTVHTPTSVYLITFTQILLTTQDKAQVSLDIDMDAKCFSLAVQVWPYLWHCCLPLRKTRLLRRVWSAACLVQVDILADHWHIDKVCHDRAPLQLTRRQIKAFIFLRTSGRELCDDKFHQFLIGSFAAQLLGPFHQCGEQASITPWVLKSTANNKNGKSSTNCVQGKG